MKLKMLNLKDCVTTGDREEKKILITSHHSAETLKNEIRKTILSYAEKGWQSYQIFCQGQFIYLKFEWSKN